MNISRNFQLILFILLAASPSIFSAETDLLSNVLDVADNSVSQEEQNHSSLKLSGQNTLLGIGPLAGEGLDRETAPTLENRIQLSFDQGQGLALAAGLELHSRMEKVGGAYQLRHDLRLGKTYVGLYSLDGIWSLYLGWLNFSWGAADRISPIDILNPLDLNLSPRRQRKLSVLGLQFQLQPLRWLGLEAVYLPFYQTNQLDVLTKLGSRLPANSKAILDKNEQDFSEPTLGARIRFYLPNFDIGLSYLFAPDAALSPAPKLNFNAVAQMYLLDTLRLKREQLHHWGFDLRLAFSQWSLWLDTAFTLNTAWQPGSYAVRSPKLSSVLGIELYYGPEQKFYANFQYGVRWLPDYRLSSPSLPRPGKTERDYQNYYLYQFSDYLAAYREGLLQRFMLHMAFPFELLGMAKPLNVSPELKITYELPLLFAGVARHHIYLNPELELSWDWQTSALHSLQFGLALGLEWFAQIEQDTIERGRYTNQVYLELRLLW